jgi:hypothetical protein
MNHQGLSTQIQLEGHNGNYQGPLHTISLYRVWQISPRECKQGADTVNVPEEEAMAPTKGDATQGATALVCVTGTMMASLLLPLFLSCVTGWSRTGNSDCPNAAGAPSVILFTDKFSWPRKEFP